MNKTLVGIFNREMTDKELKRLQDAAKDMNITSADEQGFDDVLWWIKQLDIISSDIEPSLYLFQEGRYIEILYMFDVKLVFAYKLDEDDLEKLSGLKECAERLTCIDDMVFGVREEIDLHQSQMEELTGLEADLDANRAFVIFFEHLSSDQDQIYEAAQEIFEANRYRFETSASRNDEPSSDRSSIAD